MAKVFGMMKHNFPTCHPLGTFCMNNATGTIHKVPTR